MPQIDIYTKFLCPYCTRAKALLDQKGAKYNEIDISMGGAKRQQMLERSGGRSTVPQIFIGDTHVGGSDDLNAMESAGELDGLLAA